MLHHTVHTSTLLYISATLRILPGAMKAGALTIIDRVFNGQTVLDFQNSIENFQIRKKLKFPLNSFHIAKNKRVGVTKKLQINSPYV